MTNLRLLLGTLAVLGSMSVFGQGARNIVINEVLTRNTQSIQDEYGHHEAWVELAEVTFLENSIQQHSSVPPVSSKWT